MQAFFFFCQISRSFGVNSLVLYSNYYASQMVFCFTNCAIYLSIIYMYVYLSIIYMYVCIIFLLVSYLSSSHD